MIVILLIVLSLFVFCSICTYFLTKKKKKLNIFLQKNLPDPKWMKNLDEKQLITESYTPSKIKKNEKFDTIIIGSGLSGLTTASLLSQLGKKILLLEKNDRLGGFSGSFEEKGLLWPIGIHILSNSHRGEMYKLMWDKISEDKISFIPFLDGHDTIILKNGKKFTFPYGRKKLEDNLIKMYPKEEKNIRSFLKFAFEMFVNERKKVLILRELPSFVRKIGTFFLEKFFNVKWTKLNKMSVDQILHKYFPNSFDLRTIFTAHGMYAGAMHYLPASMLVLLHGFLSNGCHYPKEDNMMAKKIGRVIKKYQGKMYVNAEVKKILSKGNKAIGVMLKNGDKIFADTIVSTAGLANTYTYIEKKFVPKDFNKNSRSFSLFQVFLALDCSYKDVDLPPTNIFIPVSGDFTTEKKWLNSDGKDFSLCPYIYFSNSNHLKGKGKVCSNKFEVFELMIGINYKIFEKYKDLRVKQRGKEYEELKEHFSNKILEYTYKYYPKIKDHIEVLFSGTPLSTQHYHGWQEGEIYGIKLDDKKLFETNEKFTRKPMLKNLFISGIDSWFGSGIPSALMSGFQCAGRIVGRNFFIEWAEAWIDEKKREKYLLKE